jgi:ribose transport system permease protein
LAVTLPLRTGEFDLSIGSVAVLTATTTAVLSARLGWNPAMAVLAGLGAALAVGAVNCVAVLWVRINAFIATLGTMTIVAGISLGITGTTVVTNIPAPIISFSQHQLFGLPLGAYYGWIIAAALWYIYRFTPFGPRGLFIGGSRDSARLAGVRVTGIQTIAFLGSALLSGLAGIVILGTLGGIDPSIGSPYLLPPYAAAFLGTATIAIGRFNVIGTLVGLYLIEVGVDGLQLLGASAWVSQVFYGAALLIAVGAARLAAKSYRRKRDVDLGSAGTYDASAPVSDGTNDRVRG